MPMEFPTGHYAARLNDHILRYGALVGLSTDPVYSPNERAWISHAMVTADLAERDARFGALWGENDAGPPSHTSKGHLQMESRAAVQTWPIYATFHETRRRRA